MKNYGIVLSPKMHDYPLQAGSSRTTPSSSEMSGWDTMISVHAVSHLEG